MPIFFEKRYRVRPLDAGAWQNCAMFEWCVTACAGWPVRSFRHGSRLLSPGLQHQCPSIIAQMFGVVAWDVELLIFGCSAPGGYVAYTGYFSVFLGMGN